MKAEDFIKVLENEDMLSGCELNKSLLIDLLNNFASQPKWIPVSERLPEMEDGDKVNGRVYVQHNECTVYILHHTLVRKESHKYWSVIKLPEPYKP